MSNQPSNLNWTSEYRRWITYAVLTALVCWAILWGVVWLPVNRFTLGVFFVALAGAISGTLMPAAAYLNVRFATGRSARVYRHRAIRQSLQAGVFVSIAAWLQMLRVLDMTIVLILVGVLVLLETFWLTRDQQPPPGPTPGE